MNDDPSALKRTDFSPSVIGDSQARALAPEGTGLAAPAPGEPAAPLEPLRPEDFYMDGPYLVFTAAYHLRRGYCCNSDCRHCPYK